MALSRRAIVDPRMLSAGLTRFFPLTANFQHPVETQNGMGDVQGDNTAWPTFPGLGAVPCAVTNQISRTGDEIRTEKTTWVEADYMIYLGGYFPQVVETMRCVVSYPEGDIVFDILSVYRDSQSSFTKMICEVRT